MPTVTDFHARNKLPNDDIQPGQFVLLFFQDDPKELSRLADTGSMFWGLVLKVEPTLTAEDQPVWYFTLMLEDGSSIRHRRTTEFAYVAAQQPPEFSDERIEARIAESTRLIEAEEARITRLKGVQAAVHTS